MTPRRGSRFGFDVADVRATMTSKAHDFRKRSRARLFTVVVLMAASLSTLSAMGCVRNAGHARGARLVVSARPYVKDIPVPAGFTLVEQSSEDWAMASLRYLRHRYAGSADKAALRDFYRVQMPLVRWSPTSDGSVHGRYTMRFTRGTETCTVEIHSGTGRSSRRVVVDILIAPATSSAPAG